MHEHSDKRTGQISHLNYQWLLSSTCTAMHNHTQFFQMYLSVSDSKLGSYGVDKIIIQVWIFHWDWGWLVFNISHYDLGSCGDAKSCQMQMVITQQHFAFDNTMQFDKLGVAGLEHILWKGLTSHNIELSINTCNIKCIRY